MTKVIVAGAAGRMGRRIIYMVDRHPGLELAGGFEQEGNLRRIAASILVERSGHKPIVIGKGGEKLKAIGTQARQDMEKLFGGKVFLELFVKVREGWMDDPNTLRRLGYD